METKTSKVLLFFKDIPGWAKGIILIIIVLLIVWLVYKFYKNVMPKTAQDINITKDKNDLSDQGQKPSFVRAWYDSAADKIYSCGAGQRVGGTDESCMYAVFVQLKNELDIVLLTEAFGIRRKGFSFSDANLGGFIADEMNPEEISALNNILARRKINYRF